MKLLALGASSIFRRRVLPGLTATGITAVDVCSASGIACNPPPSLAGRVFDRYAHALAQSDAPLVYVSTHNGLHAKLVMDSLERGKHVVVDKPAFLTLDESLRALELARSRGLTLAEANVWTEHPRALAAKRLFDDGRGATRLQAAFSFPPLPADNYRLQPALGGGALLDLGPYAVSPGRFFFGLAPTATSCHALARAPAVNGGPGVVTAFACLLAYPGGRSFTGVFGFDTGYVNTLQGLGPGLAVALDRVFTPGPDQSLPLALNRPEGPSRQVFAPADTFALFFRRVVDAVRAGDGAAFAADLLADARALAALVAAARQTEQACSPADPAALP